MMKKDKLLLYFPLLLGGIVALFLLYNINERKQGGNVRISEICSHNNTIIYGKNGEYDDYIEIHNEQSESIDLSGWRLTDSLDAEEDKPGLFLDGVVLQSGEYYIAFVSREDSMGGFALSEGDYVYLIDADGKQVDVVQVPDIEEDMVMAYLAEDKIWQNNYMPSPGNVNEKKVVEQLNMLGEQYTPTFSAESGFFDSDFYLEMSTQDDCSIYYTLDGSKPTEDSILYTEPILINDVTQQPNKWSIRTDFSVVEYRIPDEPVDKCTIIRAVAISKEGIYSKEKTASYFVGYGERYGYSNGYVISIVTDPENLFSDEKGICVIGNVGKNNKDTLDSGYQAVVNYNRDGEGWRRPAVVHVFDEEKNCVYQEEIMLGIHGGNSTLSAQKGFNLISRNGETLFTGIFGGEHKSLILRAGGVNDIRSTKFRDVLNQRLVRNRNIAIQETIPCQVFLDGEYWGFYNLRERLDLSMIASKYNVPEENIIFIKKTNVIGRSEEEKKLYDEVVYFASTHDLSLNENYRKMEEWIDVQSYIEYCCMEIYCANSDSFANNFAMWRTDIISEQPYCDGKWRWVIFDTDDSTSMLKDLGMTEPQIDSFVDGYWHRSPMDDALFSSLIENEEFRIRFAETFYDMSANDYDIDRVYEHIDELESTYTEGCVLSHRRYYDPLYTEEQYHDEVGEVSFFYASRAYFIVPYMEEHIVNYPQ